MRKERGMKEENWEKGRALDRCLRNNFQVKWNEIKIVKKTHIRKFYKWEQKLFIVGFLCVMVIEFMKFSHGIQTLNDKVIISKNV